MLGRGGAGKSKFARRLSETCGLPVIQLDDHFWNVDLTPMTSDQWVKAQEHLTGGATWILDGDLGPYDVLTPRLRAADTVFLLDFPLWRCVWRSLRRGRERADYWKWVISYRRRYLPVLHAYLGTQSEHVAVCVLRRPREVATVLRTLEAEAVRSDHSARNV